MAKAKRTDNEPVGFVARVEEPLPGAGAPTDPQSRRRQSVVLDKQGVPTPRFLGVEAKIGCG